MTPSTIVIVIDEKQATVEVEAFRPEKGDPYFLVYINDLKQWDKPHELCSFSEIDRELVRRPCSS
jgi:Immunity protein 74